MLEVSKIIRGKDRVNGQCLFPIIGISKTRGHIFEGGFKGDLGGQSFTQNSCQKTVTGI